MAMKTVGMLCFFSCLLIAMKANAGWPLGSWNGRAFIEPTVINGKVYVGCDDAVTVFSL